LCCREEVKLPSAGEALLFVEKVLDRGLKTCNEFNDEGRATMTRDEAALVRDASMLAFTLGHIGLTVRISSTRTVKAPDFAHTRCRHPNCTLKQCFGNRLVRRAVVDDRAGTEVFQEAFVLETPHHKNTDKGISQPPVQIHSDKLERLLQFYLRFARPRVSWLLQKEQNKAGSVPSDDRSDSGSKTEPASFPPPPNRRS
jgi:hypothetical protein